MLKLIQYCENELREENCPHSFDAIAAMHKDWVNWFDCEKYLDSHAVITTFAQQLGLHHLTVENMVNFSELTRAEAFYDYFALNLQVLRAAGGVVHREQVNIVLGKNFVFSVQEGVDGDVFEEIRSRLRERIGRLRDKKADYLCYRLLTAVADGYEEVVEQQRTQIANLESYIVQFPNRRIINQILELKKESDNLRKTILPLRDALYRLRNEPPHFIDTDTLAYYRDLSTEISNLIGSLDHHRDMLRDLTDLHHSNLNFQMNNVMKTLTVLSAIFIPLTFVAGVWGMNFDVMPELRSPYGYYFALLFFIILATLILFYMKIKRWF